MALCTTYYGARSLAALYGGVLQWSGELQGPILHEAAPAHTTTPRYFSASLYCHKLAYPTAASRLTFNG
jgi:hypothetical protein